jgi:hypothetical protein
MSFLAERRIDPKDSDRTGSDRRKSRKVRSHPAKWPEKGAKKATVPKISFPYLCLKKEERGESRAGRDQPKGESPEREKKVRPGKARSL